MNFVKTKRAKKPLPVIKDASKRINRERRGGGRGYASVLFSEHAALAGSRKRANGRLL